MTVRKKGFGFWWREGIEMRQSLAAPSVRGRKDQSGFKEVLTPTLPAP